MREHLETMKRKIVQALQESSKPAEELIQRFALDQEGYRVFEEAVGELCDEGKLVVLHQKPVKEKVWTAVREFMTLPQTKKENYMRPLRMTEDERRRRAFDAAVEQGLGTTRRILTLTSEA